MKDGIHRNTTDIGELSAMRILLEVLERALKENDGKVHIREIENGHVGKTIEKF